MAKLSLLQSSVSHDHSEILLIRWFMLKNHLFLTSMLFSTNSCCYQWCYQQTVVLFNILVETRIHFFRILNKSIQLFSAKNLKDPKLLHGGVLNIFFLFTIKQCMIKPSELIKWILNIMLRGSDFCLCTWGYMCNAMWHKQRWCNV